MAQEVANYKWEFNLVQDNSVNAFCMPGGKIVVIAGLVAISMLASLGMAKLPVVSGISSGMRTILLTVVIAGIAAVLFPIQEEEEAHA